ncbi:hypothetical protein EDB81DRAFT_635170 [Dactylonectria macrodidyma]|uniref:C2H2-type domain-containing protein n=1 Tax=Dactylonectria macrodidyma TaxID=307937 RepID=A0A9P9FX32_9HYPO|nr:hypothetical protein EDB81DRAFT_635170 [Dactylonectria macrodidyma]
MARDTLPPQKLLRYHPEYRILVCQKCQYALQPQAINRHLKESHEIYRSARRPYAAYAASFDLARPEDVIKAEVVEFPVPFLPFFEGLRCLGQACTYLCVSTKRMQKHWLSAHQRHGYADVDWQSASLQTFFRGNILHYFSGPSPNPDGAYESPRFRDADSIPVESTDQNLLGHFQSSTCKTLVNSQHEQVWRHAVPNMAEKNPFLMHAILACSALHLATKNPSNQQHLVSANNHQNKAMVLFREAVACVTETNCEAIVAFSHLLIVYSLGAERHDKTVLLTPPPSSGPDGLCSWLYFIRNWCSLVNGYKHVIAAGPLAWLVQRRELPIGDVNEQKVSYETSMVSAVIREGADIWSYVDCEILNDAAQKLGRAFVAAGASGDGIDAWYAVRDWPMIMSVEFTRLLAQENPAALVLLGYYCLLLKKLQSLWFIATYPLHLLYALKGRLSGRWHRHIDPLIVEWEQGCGAS